MKNPSAILYFLTPLLPSFALPTRFPHSSTFALFYILRSVPSISTPDVYTMAEKDPFQYHEGEDKGEEEIVDVYGESIQMREVVPARRPSSSSTTIIPTPSSASSSSSAPSVKKRAKSITEGGLPSKTSMTIREHHLFSRKEVSLPSHHSRLLKWYLFFGKKDQPTACPPNAHPRCIVSPSPLLTNLFPQVGSSELHPPAYSPEGPNML